MSSHIKDRGTKTQREEGLSSKPYAEPEGKPSSEFRLLVAKLGLAPDT